jgi:hypothetical protein
MAKRSSRPNKDVNQLAAVILAKAIGELPEPVRWNGQALCSGGERLRLAANRSSRTRKNLFQEAGVTRRTARGAIGAGVAPVCKPRDTSALNRTAGRHV